MDATARLGCRSCARRVTSRGCALQQPIMGQGAAGRRRAMREPAASAGTGNEGRAMLLMEAQLHDGRYREK